MDIIPSIMRYVPNTRPCHICDKVSEVPYVATEDRVWCSRLCLSIQIHRDEEK